MSNERTRKYFENQDFLNKFEAVKSNPDLMQELIQNDPRFMDVFSTITGIDLLKMQEDQMREKEKQEKMQRDAMEAAKKRAEEEKKRKEEEAF